LRTGKVYKFRTAPVDPYDAFRGKYVALSYASAAAPVKNGDNIPFQSIAYASLSQDENGFARFGELSVNPPLTGDYLRVEHQFTELNDKAHFRLPLDRFYMEESKAPQAEQAYRRYGNRGGQTKAPTYVAVRVKNGRGVIEDLFINDQPIREFLKTMTK
jgi:uncharacterized membrane-anchored protein